MLIIYFASISEEIGLRQENIDLPPDINKISQLLDWLQVRGCNYQKALEDRGRVKIAINQALCQNDVAISNQDEIAIFPPVTGG